MLHLALIAFDKILQHLLGANANFKMVYFFLEGLLHVALIYVLSDSNVCGKWVIWSSEDIHRVVHGRTE